MTAQLRSNISEINKKICNIESNILSKCDEMDKKTEKFKNIDDQILHIKKNDSQICTINVGGKIFHSKLSTLLSSKNNIFYKYIYRLLESGKSLSYEFFFDRPFKKFDTILNLMRYSQDILKTKDDKTLCPIIASMIQFNNEYENEDLLNECQYYGLYELIDQIDKFSRVIEIIGMDASPKYSTAGDHDYRSLSDEKNKEGGVCVQSPYEIILELNYIHTIKSVDIKGWDGNTSIWNAGNGVGAKISTSIDKYDWKEVGKLPSPMNSIVNVPLTVSNARYVKFKHTGYLGLGYVKFKGEFDE